MFDKINWTEATVDFFLGDHLHSSIVNTSFRQNLSELEMATATNPPDGPMKFSPSLLLSFTVCLALLVTVGLIGNTVVIFALIRTRAHRATTTNAYILNLSIADLLFLLFCVPFQGTVYILNDWPFGEFMCKAAHFCQYCTMYASIWVLTVMSVDRYLAIGHPLKSVDWRSPGQAMRICCYVWLTSAVLSIPWLILYRTQAYPNSSGVWVTACFDFWDAHIDYRKWLFLVIFITGFVLPTTIIFFMSVLVARSIRNAVEQPWLTTVRPTNGNSNQSNVISKRRRRVVWLVFGLALTFFLCWLPQNASFMWLNFDRGIAEFVERHYKIFFIFKIASHMLTYVNSSINPILYSLASGRFRSRLAHALFMRGASSFNNRGTVSRPRSVLGNRNSTSKTRNGSGLGGHDSKNTNNKTRNGKSFPPLLYASTSNYSRTEDEFGSRSNSVVGGYCSQNSSSRTTTNQLCVPGSASPGSPQSGTNTDSPSPRRPSLSSSSNQQQRESSFSKNLNKSTSIVGGGGGAKSLDRLAAMNRQRALTWTTTTTTLASSANIGTRENSANGSFEDSIYETRKEEQVEGNLVKKQLSPKRKRFFLFRQRRV